MAHHVTDQRVRQVPPLVMQRPRGSPGRGGTSVAATLALVFGVLASTPAQAQEPSASSAIFSPAGSLAEGRSGHTATPLPDGRVLVIGGGAANGYLASVELWDPATGTFQPAGSLAHGRGGHTATPLPDGRILVIGGGGGTYAENRFVPQTELWDPATGTFGDAGSLDKTRALHTATLLPDGRVLVVGGYDAVSGGRLRAAAEIWDPATRGFTRAGTLGESRYGHTATLLPDGRVLIAGGVAIADTGFTMLATTEVWDSATGAFSPGPALVEPRATHTATPLSDGRILLVGGLRSPESFAGAELWDPRSGTGVRTESPAAARTSHSATDLPDGRVLVIGGRDGTGLVASAELWDPGTGSFSPAGTMTRGRDFHTATLLLDGRVLVVGGGTDAETWGP